MRVSLIIVPTHVGVNRRDLAGGSALLHCPHARGGELGLHVTEEMPAYIVPTHSLNSTSHSAYVEPHHSISHVFERPVAARVLHGTRSTRTVNHRHTGPAPTRNTDLL